MSPLASLRRRHAATPAILLLAFAATAACGGGAERPPDVILISLDTLNRSALAAYDEEAAPLPALDAFAAEALRFDRAYSAASWTLPSHASLFTGLYPDRHGATDKRVTLAADVPTLAEGLRKRGYQTVGLNGGGFLDEQYGMGRGFERYESFERTKRGPAETGEALAGRVKAFLDEHRSPKRPLFLFLHSYIIHNYYDVRPEAAELAPDPGYLTRQEYVACALGRKKYPERVWDQMRALYDAELKLFDAAFADLVATLRAAGIWDEAIVLFTTDHGEGFDPGRERLHHGGRLHFDQLHIPLLVRTPDSFARSPEAPHAPRVIDTPVSLVDVLPTLHELAGIPAPDGIDGRSFAALLRGEDDPELHGRTFFGMEHYAEWEDGTRLIVPQVSSMPVSTAVIDDRHWYIRHGQEDELYDNAADPDQTRNLAPEGMSVRAFRDRAHERERPRPETARRGEGKALDQQLNDLGYGGQ